MATVKQLLRNPGPFITALLPDVQALVATNDPYLINEAAKAVFDKQQLWGGGTIYERLSQYPTAMSNPIDRNKFNTALIKNFLFKLNGFTMSASNSWLEFQKFVDVFYQLLDPVSPFTLDRSDLECPPDYQEPCLDVASNFYITRIGIYERPMTSTGTEGTGFSFANPVIGDPTTEQEVQIGFRAPYPYTDPHALALNDRYFVMNYDAAADDWDVIWYNYQGTGTEPVFTGGSGTINYHEVALAEEDQWPEIKAKTDLIVIATGRWADGTVICWDKPPGTPGRKQIPCPFKVMSQYVAAAIGARQNTRDGDGGYLTPITTMYASDTTELATGLLTDVSWQNAHNDMRVPYEKLTFDNDYMYLKSIKALDDNDTILYCDGCSYCSDPCIMRHAFLQTPAVAIINEIPVNVPGVLNNNAAGNNRLPVVD